MVPLLPQAGDVLKTMPRATKSPQKAKAAAPAAKAATVPAKAAKKAGSVSAAPRKSAAAPASAASPAPVKKVATTAKKAPAPVKKALAAPAAPAKIAAAKSSPAKAPVPVTKTSAATDKFLEEQRILLLSERAEYVEKAAELKAEAESLAMEHEPGDVQFDEEGGEGGTTNVDRELDLVLSAQARAAVDEIDRALAKIGLGTYGLCERCGKEIPKPRLKALPYAALCVSCKSGGLSHR
jgi:DnaK suppressor protein